MAYNQFTRSVGSRAIAISLAFGLTCMPGCSGPMSADDLVAAANKKNIQRVTSLYGAFHTRNEMRGPADESEFKTFLASYNPKRLRRIGIEPSDVEQIFVSERDGEHFRIRYGVRGHLMGSDAPVVFEATGVDGMRMVGRLNMTQEEVDAAEYDRLWSGDGDPGPGATR